MKRREFEQIGIEFIRSNELLKSGDLILIGCSGGADSICLATFLMRVSRLFDLKLSLVHVNHNIRDNSKNDELFVREFAQNNLINLEVISIKIGDQKGTLEEKARKMRHEAFQEVASKLGAKKIALGHTSSDRAETVLHNLARGSGLTGTGTMKPKNGNLIRPILFATRDEVLDYLEENNQKYIEDESNLDISFSRNRIRHNIIPELKKIFSGAEKSISRFADISGTESEYLNQIAKQLYDECVKEENEKSIVEIERIRKHHLVIIRRVIRMIMTKNMIPPTLNMVEQVLELTGRDGSVESVIGKFFVKKDKKTLTVSSLRDLV